MSPLPDANALRFPRDPTTGNARAINQAEPDWQKSLTGLAKIAHDDWAGALKPKGCHLRAELGTFPGSRPGDCVLIPSWAE